MQNSMKVELAAREGMTQPASFAGVSALLFATLLFATSTALTIVWCVSMPAMGGMRMPGNWTMSMAWMRMPGQTWPEAAASFAGMWAVMMVAMMLPSVAPLLWRYRRAVPGADETGKAWLATLAGAGYFFAWTLFGMAVYPLGVVLAMVEMREPVVARSVPLATGVVILLAGAMQFSSFKSRHLGCCQEVPGHGRTFTAGPATAWRHGLGLAIHCIYCCGGFTAVLLAIGVMDLRAMGFVGAAITLERLAPGGKRVAQGLGAVLTGLGLLLIARHLSPAGFFPLN